MRQIGQPPFVQGSVRRVPAFRSRFERPAVRGRLRFCRLGLLPTVILLLALAGTTVGYYFARDRVATSRERMLGERAREFTAVFDALVGQTEVILGAAAAVVEATGGDPASFRSALDERVKRSVLSSVGLVRVSAGGPVLLAEAGRSRPLLLGGLDAADKLRLAAIDRPAAIRLVKAAELGQGRVIGFAVAPRLGSPFRVYAEVVLPDLMRLSAFAPPDDLQFAFYLGASEASGSLLVSNTAALPIAGRRVAVARSIGSEQTTLVVGARGHLGGRWLSAAPLLVLVLGSVGAVLVATLAETRRRREAAERQVSDLAHETAALDRALSLQQRVEHELRASEERYRSLVELSPDLIAVHAEGRIAFVNQAGAALLGAREPAELVGKPVLEIVHPDYRSAVEQRIGDVVAHRRAAPFLEERFVRLDGATVDVDVAALPTTFEGEPAAQVIARDISERRRSEQQRARVEERLHQSQKLEAVGQLAGGIAHDFNNLLTVIGGFGQLVLDGLGADDPLRESVQEITLASEQASALVRQLLAFSRRQVAVGDVADVNAVVSELERTLLRLIGEDIRLVTRVEAVSGWVRADATQLEQVILNLALNARDAMPHGGVLTVETADVCLDDYSVACQVGLEPGAYVLLCVSDSGAGMDEETRARIFEPFFTTKQPGEGTGLGLASVWGIVTQRGGRICVYSEPGVGTSFRVYLPQAAERGAPDEQAVVPGCGAGSETVLLVEDNARVRAFASRGLAESGYSVLEASCPSEALARSAAHEGPIDLLVTDVVMPEMHGPALADALLADRPGLRALYMSGYTEQLIEAQGVTDAAAAFLEKPFSRAELCRRVRERLDAAPTTATACGVGG